MPGYDWSAHCAAVVPCLDEEKAIGTLVSGVREHLSTVVVVDDGCRDATAVRAASAGAVVLRNESTHGKGAALSLAWRWALEHGFNWALNLDGDGQHSPKEIPGLLSCSERTGALLVVGNRMARANSMPLLRRLVNRWMSRRLSQTAGRLLPDSQCGFRLMNLRTWESNPTRTHHFEIESEVLISFARAGANIEFVPIETVYKDEQSKIHPFRDTVRWLSWWRRASAEARSRREKRD